MDCYTWMYNISRNTHEYVSGVKEFIECVVENLKRKGREQGKEVRMTCPCNHCYNLKKYPSVDIVKEYLLCHGFMDNYTKQIWHGEGIHSRTKTSDKNHESDGDSVPNNKEDDADIERVEEMIQDAEDFLIH